MTGTSKTWSFVIGYLRLFPPKYGKITKYTCFWISNIHRTHVQFYFAHPRYNTVKCYYTLHTRYLKWMSHMGQIWNHKCRFGHEHPVACLWSQTWCVDFNDYRYKVINVNMEMDIPWLAREAKNGCPFQWIDKECTVTYWDWPGIGYHNIQIHYVKGDENTVNR